MAIEFSRIRNGIITAVRYTEANLKFGDTLAIVQMTGDSVIPLFSPAPNLSDGNTPVYRPPTQDELNAEIMNLSDLDTNLYEYDLGLTVASLNDDARLPIESVPSSVVTYQGEWDPIKNIPELKDGVGDTGQVYIVKDGFPNDVEIDLGSGVQVVRSDTKLEYREGIWKSTGFIMVSDRERYLLDNAMVMNPNVKYGPTYGTEQGSYDIVSFPDILETLNGGIIVGQLITVNGTRDEILLVDNDGLEGLVFIDTTGEIYLDAKAVSPKTYNPKFIVSGPWGRSAPISVRLDVLEYTLEYTSPEIVVPSGDVHEEVVFSPQDPDPELYIIDDGGMWNAAVSEDGRKIELDTFCVDEGMYGIDVIATSDKGTSEILTVETEVVLAPDQPNPFWQKSPIYDEGMAVIPDENTPSPRLDVMSIDAMPLDSKF